MKHILTILFLLALISCDRNDDPDYTFQVTLIESGIESKLSGFAYYDTTYANSQFVTTINVDLGCEDNRFCEQLGLTFFNDFSENLILTDSIMSGNTSSNSFLTYYPNGVCDTPYVLTSGEITVKRESSGILSSDFDFNLESLNFFNPPASFDCEGFDEYPIRLDSTRFIQVYGNFEAEASK